MQIKWACVKIDPPIKFQELDFVHSVRSCIAIKPKIFLIETEILVFSSQSCPEARFLTLAAKVEHLWDSC